MTYAKVNIHKYDVDCHYSCQKCSSSGSSSCLECLSDGNRFLENSICKCQANYYDENNELFCQRCRFPCLNCQGKQNQDCLSCKNSMFLFGNECKCGEHQFFNYVNYQCEGLKNKIFQIDCHPTCSKCNGSLNSNCVKCNQEQYTLLQSNICICKDGYYRSIDNNCYQCDINCKTCSGPTNNDCLSCYNNKSGSSCDCPYGYYQPQLVPNTSFCFKCHPTCQTCSNSGEFNCLTCYAFATLQPDSNMCLCDLGFVWNGNSCSICDTACGNRCIFDPNNCCVAPCVQCFNPNCSTCDGTQACTSCQQGKTGANCNLSCDPNCKGCDRTDKTLCTSCNSPFVVVGGICSCPSGQELSGSTCVSGPTCPDGFYGAGCSSVCHLSCRRCYGSSNTQCNLCKNNAYVSGTCVCNLGYYMDGTYNCFPCHYSCRQCTGSSTHCTDCNYSHRTLDGSNQCVCDMGYYDFGIPICQPTNIACGVYCGNCQFISSAYQCQACALSGTFRLNNLASNCPCQDGYFDNGSMICEQCNYKCFKCASSTSCTICSGNRDSSNNCDCLSGYDEQNKICVLISVTANQVVIDYNSVITKTYDFENCNITNFANIDTCQCLDGYFMQNSKCLRKQFIYIPIACHRKCKTCSIISTNCIECSTNYINPPSCSCVNGFQLIDQVCVSCNQHCVLCSNNQCSTCISPLIIDTDNTCQCNTGYYFDQSSNSCSNCQTQCYQCKYQSDYCTKCNFNRILPFKCVCPEGTYEVSQSQPCENCSKRCFTCETNASTCIQCATLRINSPSCICPDGYYESSNLDCLKCSKKCQTCELSATNCLLCSSNRSTSECQCNEGYYENNNEVCIKCNVKCKTCNGSNENDCLTCDLTRNFIQSNTSCLCKKGYYYENNTCNVCVQEVVECQTNYCGDGIKQPYEQCDDWNKTNRDGCNSQCKVEEGYQCTLIQNLQLSPLINYSSCIQCADVNCKSCPNIELCFQCKSGYFLNKNQCSPCDLHCKECSGPSKKQCKSCLFETFQTEDCQLCEDTQGLYLEFGNCISKCGDGMIRLTEQCDDGNTVDGDGCSSNCKLEQHWVCSSNNSTQSKCDIADPPIATITFEDPISIYQSNRFGVIKINKIMQIDQIKAQQLWLQEIKGMNQTNYFIEFGYDVNYNQSTSQITLNINLYESQQNMIYQITFTNYLPSDSEGQQLSTQFLEYQLGDFYKVSQLQMTTAATSKKVGLFFLATLGGAAIIGLLMQSLEFYWNTLDMLQLFSYLAYINVKFPYLHLEFLAIFKFVQMDFLNDLMPISFIQIGENENYHNYPLLVERDVQENLLLNLSSIFVTYGLPFLIYFVCRLITKLNHKYLFDQILISDSRSLGPCQIKLYVYQILYYINKTANIYERSFFFQILLRVHLSSLLDLNFAIFTTVYCWTQHQEITLNDTLQYLFANLIILAQLVIIIILSDSMLVKKYQFESIQYKLKYGSLFEGFQIIGIQNRQAALLQPFKKILFMASLLVFFNNALYQIGLLTSLQMISAIISIVLQPSENTLETTKAIIQDFGILISLNFILIYYVQDNFNYFSQDTIEWISYFQIGVYILMLSTQILIDCYMQIKFLFKKYPKLKQCSAKKEGTPVISDNTNYYLRQQFIVIQPIKRPIKFKE
ncbi:unnamed protein product (macronuclear) [Paramecium tetraurelia]|uniref:EGF-like domain-containing protein n=1 Tax=Paramecium tetraurelia TaxID=5888 RepID=A0EBY5_PARTE|nr:uncharacterized protein GSPATT00025538001 [Paramecium tetraurelia]CAK92802.1 unnamed protein product [Paramecium tetraurelia]|eukprot:XP_001460199.1 hypothetical protein (macronuclear) [Paramecium tetraurelia strain d4-2]